MDVDRRDEKLSSNNMVLNISIRYDTDLSVLTLNTDEQSFLQTIYSRVPRFDIIYICRIRERQDGPICRLTLEAKENKTSTGIYESTGRFKLVRSDVVVFASAINS